MLRTTFALALLAAACNGAPKNQPPPPFVSNCTVAAPSADAQKLPSRDGAKSAVLPGARQVTPAGTLLDTGGFPIAVRALPPPNERYVVLSDDAEDDEALRVVDLQAPDPLHPVVSQIAYPLTDNSPHVKGLFYGMALDPTGTRLYVSNGGYDPVDDTQPPAAHYNTIQVIDIAGSPPQLTANDPLTLKLMFNDGRQRIPAGIALSADGKLLYAATQNDGTLAILSLTPGAGYGAEIGRAQVPGLGPYDVAVDEATHTAFVSLWGGLTLGAGPVDGVVPVDVSNPMAPVAAAMPIPTGKGTEAELLLAGKLYVANADADTLSIVDAASHAVQSSPASSGMILGASPSSLAIDAARGRVYLANAGENSVAALDLNTFKLLGRLPTAWYPSAVAVLSDGSLVIASTRGLGHGPNDGSPPPPFAAGTVQLVPPPSLADLQAGDAQVAANLDRPQALQPAIDCAAGAAPKFPLPPALGDDTPIKHVFLVVRENKTYDGLFGDIAEGNGSAQMVSFGEMNTPNAHQLARDFVLLDNFYSHAELSVQGHEWTTGCVANDFTEKTWQSSDTYGRAYRAPVVFGPPSSVSRLAYPGSDSIWVHLDKAGVPYHNYGEVTNTSGAMTQADPGYPGVFFNTSISDVDKADYIVQTITDPLFTVEPFTYMLLPNDHTNGTGKGQQTPQSMVADNDEGTGKFIDGLSHSSLWASSLVFVVEDDPGGTLDHVESHRSICLVLSPWVKRQYHSSTNFDLGSIYKTIELIIGVKPMNITDAHAAGMYELFTTTPDLTPYTYIPRKIPMQTNADDAPLADESARIDFTRPDQADLTRILWKATHGRDAEPPYRRPARLERDGDD